MKVAIRKTTRLGLEIYEVLIGHRIVHATYSERYAWLWINSTAARLRREREIRGWRALSVSDQLAAQRNVGIRRQAARSNVSTVQPGLQGASKSGA